MSWRFSIRYSHLDLLKCVTLRRSRCIFSIGPSSSIFMSFSMLLITSTFLICSLHSHILLTNCFATRHSVVCMSLCKLPLLACTLFRCFGISCFVCIVLSSLDIFWSPFFHWDLLVFPRVLLLILFVLFFSRSDIFQLFSSVLSFSIVDVDFLAFPV